MDARFDDLVEQLRAAKIDRRTFAVRAAALGVSALGIGAALRAQGAAAQDATPEGSPGASPVASPGATPSGTPTTAAEIGQPGIAHSTDTSQGRINLYSSWPMSGASEQIGGDSAESVRLAVELYGGAAGGFALTYEPLDDGLAANNGAWDQAREAENATRVLNDPDAVAYIGTYNSGAAEVAIPILNQAVPPMGMVSPANTAVGLTKALEGVTEPDQPGRYYPTGVRNYMRVVPTDDIQGGASANWAYDVLGARRAYVLHDNQIYGQGVAAVFRDVFQSLGGEILGFEAYQADAPDYQALMTSVADAGPDIVYVGAIVNLNTSKVLQDMRSVMPADQVAFLGPDGLINQAFVDGAGEAAEGAYLTFSGVTPQQLEGAGADWYSRMKERIGGREPDAYSVYAYEAAIVVLQAIDRVGAKDRRAILDAMFATEGFQGLLGTWSFDENGDRDSVTVSLNVVEGGQITFQEFISA